MEERLVTPLAGVASILLFVLGVVVIESGDTPGDEATGAEQAAYYADSLGTLAVGAVLWGVGIIALIWFLDGLRTHILPASGQLARLTYGFGFGAALFLLGSITPDVAAAIGSDNLERPLESGAAEAAGFLGDGFFIVAELMLAGFFLAVGLAAVRARALPAWLGWISLLLAVVAIIPPIGWAVVVFGFPIWVLLTSALLWRSKEVVPAAAA
jgi:hypothetical protein